MKQVFKSKVLRKVLILSCLVIGLIFAANDKISGVAAASDSCQEQSECLNQAYQEYFDCDMNCPPFAGCYYQCQVRYDQAQNVCYENYPCP